MNFMLALCLAVASQCPGGACPSPSFPLPQFQPSVVRIVDEPPLAWHKIKHDGLSFYVWGQKLANGKVSWDPDASWNVEQYKTAKDARSLAERKALPALRPRKPKNFGLDVSRIGHHGVRYTADSEAARQFVERAKANSEKKPQHAVGAELRHKFFVTVIGTDDDAKAAREDWKSNPELAEFHDKVWFATYSPNDWQVDPKLGFQKGRPEVVVQKADGQVLYRADSYAGAGPIARALRVADPNYDPSRDPGGSSPIAVPKVDLEVLAAVAGVLLIVLFLPGRTRS